MSVHHLLTTATYAITPGRLVGSVAALVALAGVVIGLRALVRHGRQSAFAALFAGVAGMATGGAVVAAAEGGPGTGYGIVGGFAALAIGLVAAVLGGLALARSRHTA
ncbi:DUF6223 family protein [Amycolatopsis sp. NPDC051061]|uniref:DUF6223 family protein n=1 Tax=Amycolatopsis sp. NPDC051061 TaxID=3155042 RepID=UPI003413ACC2